MYKSDIKKTLSQLKIESGNINPDDSNTAESINHLINKLEEQLSAPEITGIGALAEHMRSTIEELECSHPRITAIVNDLMVKLAGIGV